ncbi:MAG TPA: ROK family protein [Chloroflexota bacterium]
MRIQGGAAIREQRASNRVAAAVDIGGTKVAAGLVSESGSLLHQACISTRGRGGQALVEAALDLVRGELAQTAGRVVGIGVSVAGAVDSSRGRVLWSPNIPGWHDIQLGRPLSEATGLPVVVGFDGHLTALGESWKGAGQGARNMVLLIIGTGVGGGMIQDGHLYRGSDNLAGAAGWIIVDPQTSDSPSSLAKGNLESVASGPAIATAAERMLREGTPSSLHLPVTAEAVVNGAIEGDNVSIAVLDHAGACLGRAVAGIVSLMNPELVVLGGGVGSTGVFVKGVRTAVARYAQPISRKRVRVEPALLGNDAGLYGAARALFEHFEQSSAASAQGYSI